MATIFPSTDNSTREPWLFRAFVPSISSPIRVHPIGPKFALDWSVTSITFVESYAYTLTFPRWSLIFPLVPSLLGEPIAIILLFPDSRSVTVFSPLLSLYIGAPIIDHPTGPNNEFVTSLLPDVLLELYLNTAVKPFFEVLSIYNWASE